ncbi:MAG: class I SAM-dependent DNA methyltransferase [Candidatus Shapirobacteria bacterium]|nr:class I SAM-dependent DNA methyltransferase [Candidatus Shapirobacteria bacterium]
MVNINEYANFIWSVADTLRGDYKQADYGKVILPLTVIRRLDSVLSDTKENVLKSYESQKITNLQEADLVLNKIAGYKFHNHSKFDFSKLISDPDNIVSNLRNYINGFSENARDILENFEFDKEIHKLDKANLLYQVVKQFQEINLHPSKINNHEMGYLFEELIRKFAEASNETAGEHFTPREVIKLMVNILFISDSNILRGDGIIKTLYDPACGTGGMMSVAEEYLKELNPDARLELFGQELNPESYAVCKSDMLIKVQDPDHVKLGDTLRNDQLRTEKFDYMLSNPPFGVNWKKAEKEVKQEYEDLGFGGRFGAGLPSISDGSMLFLQHMVSKMKPTNGGSRLAIVFNGSPLFSGSAGSGPSEIRRWIIENDMLEAIIALPDQLFYNTGISTYIWVVTNRKSIERKGKVQLINAVSSYKVMRKKLGDKRNEIGTEDIDKIVSLYGEFSDSKFSKIFDNSDFGYSQLTVERPLKDEKGNIIKDTKGKPKADPKLRDSENVPLKEDIQEYFKREVVPFVPDAWIDESKTKVGYEINFTKYFYEYKPLRSLEEITKDILELEKESDGLLKEITK